MAKWPCCSGTLVQTVADDSKNLYFHDDQSLLVNLFVPSTVRWARPGGEVELERTTDYPAKDITRLTVRKGGSGRFAIKLRVPAWASGASLRVNGVAAPARPGQIASLSRVWKAGDRIELVLPQAMRTLPIDDQNPKLQAVMRGPVMYVALNPWDGLEAEPVSLPGGLSKVGGQDEAYRLGSNGRELVLVPYHRIDTETYQTYFVTG